MTTTTRAMPDDSTATRPVRRPGVTVRPGRPEDHPAVVSLVKKAYAPFRAMLPRRIWVSLMADLLDLDRHSSNGHLLVAEVDGRIGGSGLFYPQSSVQGLGWPPGWAGGRG